MTVVELRDTDAVRTYVLQGLWLQRASSPAAARVRPVLEWTLAVASEGHPLPGVGFVADLGALAFGVEPGKLRPEVPGWPAGLASGYEDHVLGRIDADRMFERAADALRRYAEKDRPRGLAYVVRQLHERLGLGGVEVPPAAVRGLLSTPADQLHAEGYESLSRDGPLPLLLQQIEELIRAFRRLADVLGPEDVIALEQRTALADLGQYVAHRQVLQLTARIEARLPARPVRPTVGRKEVPARVADEDQYPVGGYSSISTKGSIESLLHSQLAYMERESPDLFDAKLVRDELFYYSRDENQFLRRRRAFVVALFPDLVAARFKDPELPAQRVVLVLALVLALTRRLADWLSTDALHFDVAFVRGGGADPLAHEKELLDILLWEPVRRGVATVRVVDEPTLAAECAALGRTSQTHVLAVSAGPVGFNPANVVTTRLVVGARPGLTDGRGEGVVLGEEEPFDSWAEAAVRLLGLWV